MTDKYRCSCGSEGEELTDAERKASRAEIKECGLEGSTIIIRCKGCDRLGNADDFE